MQDDALLELIHRIGTARRCGVLLAADEARAEAAFGCSRKLAVYGTLAPGERNHHELGACRGTWTPATVTGRRSVHRFPEFTFDAAAEPVPMQLFASDDLPAHWPALDAFEGPDYCRILVPVRKGAAGVTVANLYEARRRMP